MGLFHEVEREALTVQVEQEIAEVIERCVASGLKVRPVEPGEFGFGTVACIVVENDA